MFAFIILSSMNLLAQASGNTCPLSMGFWKNHPNDWPMNVLALGDQTYSKNEAIDIISSSTTGDASITLARQLIATTLNVGMGSDPNPIVTQFNQANTLLSGYGHKLPYEVDPSTPNGQAMVNVSNTLASYNTNHMTPHCTPPPTPLPIQLASFTGVALNSSTVLLRWTTLSELNNYGFFVQRRQAQAQEYAEIPNSFVPGHGTTVEPQYYSFTDYSAAAASWYYRLRQIDLDGTEHYTDAILVDVLTSVPEEAPRVFSLAQNYPNPFNPTTTIVFTLPFLGTNGAEGREGVGSFVSLKVYDLLGRELATLVNEEKVPGAYMVTWNASGFASGGYIYRLTAGRYVDAKRLLLLK